MTAKRSHPRVPILLRLEPEELALIDRCRMQMARTDFIRGAVRERCHAPSIKRALKMFDDVNCTL